MSVSLYRLHMASELVKEIPQPVLIGCTSKYGYKLEIRSVSLKHHCFPLNHPTVATYRSVGNRIKLKVYKAK